MDDVDALFWYEPRPQKAVGYERPVLDPEEIRGAFGAARAELLGRGAFGETWRLSGDAFATTGDAAAKVIYRDGYPPERLARETDGLLRTSSPNVVKLLEARTVDLHGGSRAALLFEFVKGGDVAGAIGAGAWPRYPEVHAFAAGVLTGLVALHGTNTAHRDIKPENIALREGDWAQPVILDLGLSKQLDVDALTTYPQLLGTLPFMAPEQIRGEEARKAADVWALGCVLHLLLTRQHPFFGAYADAVHRADALSRVVAGAPPLPADVPEPLRSVVTRLLSPTEHERGSARRALSDLSND